MGGELSKKRIKGRVLEQRREGKDRGVGLGEGRPAQHPLCGQSELPARQQQEGAWPSRASPEIGAGGADAPGTASRQGEP